MPTLASVENTIRTAAPEAARSAVKKAAKLHIRRFESFTRVPTHEEALLLVKAIVHSDPTGDHATRNVMREKVA